MTRRGLIGVSVVLFLLVCSNAAWAQVNGSIRGRAVDTGGQPLPGVTIVVTGEVFGDAQRTAVTSPSGGFNFPALPIGTYTVSAELAGFQRQAAEDVRVAIGKVSSVDFSMPEEFSEEITVIAESPIVDVSSPTFNTRFDGDQIIDLPTRGNFYDMIAMTPGVSQMDEGSSWVSAFGADVKSSQWNIDGLDRTAPEGGDLSWSINDELVAEIQVLGTGATAEYGGMLGTAFNVVTKSGTNEFHGSATLDYFPPNWVDENGRREDAPEGAQTYNLDHHNNLSLTLGGPIVKDKVWFFVGAEFGRFLAFGPFEDSTLPNQKETTWDNFDAKITAQLAQNHRLNLTASSHEYIGPSSGDIFSEPSQWSENWSHDKMAALDYSAILGQNTVLEARAGFWRGDNEYRSQYPTGEPTYVDQTVYPWLWSGDVWWQWEWEQHADDAEVIITQHAENFISGDHEFRFGVQYSGGGGTTKTFNPHYYYQREYEYYLGYPYVYQYWYTGLPYYYGGEAESIGAFVTDSWTVSSRVTLDLGVRYDRHKGWVEPFNRLDTNSNSTGEVIPGKDLVDWNNVDPRLGFAWQPTGNGRSVLRGSIGLFHAGMTSGDWYAPPPEVGPWTTYWLNGAEWEVLSTWESTPDTFLIPGTDNASTWEYTLGFDQQIGDSSAIGVQLVYKKTTNQIGWYIADDGVYENFEWTDPETGNTFTLRDYSVDPTRFKGNSSGPGAAGGDRPYDQDYQGFFLTYTKRFSKSWDFLASYSYSKAEGLNPRFFTSDWSGQGSVLYANRAEADPNAFINSNKLLAGDRRHILRFVGSVVLPYQFKISGVINLQSGRTYDRHQTVRLPNRGFTEIITSPATDSQRLPNQYLVDLGIGKRFSLGKGTDLSIDLQVLNLFNDDAVEWWRDLNYPVGGEPLPGGWVLPRRAELRLRFTF